MDWIRPHERRLLPPGPAGERSAEGGESASRHALLTGAHRAEARVAYDDGAQEDRVARILHVRAEYQGRRKIAFEFVPSRARGPAFPAPE